MGLFSFVCGAILTTSVRSHFLSSPSPRACFTVRRNAAHIVATEEEDPLPLLLGGLPIEEGDGVLVDDDESGAWWRG